MATDLATLLTDLRNEQADLRVLVQDADLDTPTPAEGWDVRDAVAHLAGTDVEALLAATQPEAFVAKLPQVAADIDGFVAGRPFVDEPSTSDPRAGVKLAWNFK